MIYLYLLLTFLAVWRVTYDFIALDGPWGMYSWLRGFVEKSAAPRWAKEGVTCGYCVSFSTGFLVALLCPVDWPTYVLLSLGSSGAVTLLARYLKSMYGADIFD